MQDPRKLSNPVTLSAIAGLALFRGVSYIWAWVEPRVWNASDLGPSLPYVPLQVVGMVWVCAGMFLLLSMVRWSWFRPAVAVITSCYLVWAILYFTDIFVSPELVTVVAMAGYAVMVPVTITLGSIELEKAQNLKEQDNGKEGAL